MPARSDGKGRGSPRFARPAPLAILAGVNPLSPRKLLLSKWTAVRPVNLEKHFLVTRIVLPDPTDLKIEWVEMEAVHSGATRRVAWRELKDEERWHQGWV